VFLTRDYVYSAKRRVCLRRPKAGAEGGPLKSAPTSAYESQFFFVSSVPGNCG
jgi:hypothetical protein